MIRLRSIVPALLGIALSWTLQSAELPIREVILYKHGVGFFERSGSIPAGDSARLDFKASEMNDVLKSLIINGKTERVTGLRYDSSIPLDQKLAEFPFRIDPSQPLSGVLDQLKGARLEMQVGSEKIAGSVVAARLLAGDKDRAERQQIVLLMDSGDMRMFDLDAASSIRFTDAKLQAQFRDYLGALTAARSRDKRSVYIDGNTAGGRDITAQYIIPTPIWKSSYRLIFPASGEPTLEGWAIVDNTTGEDWSGVQMALVSGKPISFISELYAPRYIRRQTAELPEEQSVKPVLYEGQALASAAPMAKGRMDASRSMPGMTSEVSADASQSSAQTSEVSSIGSTAVGSDLADLFEYRIAQPVTIKKGASAMLPFLQDKIKARRVVVYSDRATPHPLIAAELVNSTPKTLDGGPLTVYDGGAYVGEALVETVKASDKRLISYGVDLGTRITTKLDSEDDEVREIHVSRGVLTTRVAEVRRTTYSINNLDSKPKTLIIEHPIENGFRVLNRTPSETTSKALRFEVTLAPSMSIVFPVIDEDVEEQTFTVSKLKSDTLLIYTRNKQLSANGRKELQAVLDLQRQIAANAADIQNTRAKIAYVVQDEERVRKNLESLNRVSGQQDLVQKYAGQLAQLEQQVAALRDHESELTAKSAQLSAAVDELIEKISF